jgi:hypothetical protein
MSTNFSCTTDGLDYNEADYAHSVFEKIADFANIALKCVDPRVTLLMRMDVDAGSENTGSQTDLPASPSKQDESSTSEKVEDNPYAGIVTYAEYKASLENMRAATEAVAQRRAEVAAAEARLESAQVLTAMWKGKIGATDSPLLPTAIFFFGCGVLTTYAAFAYGKEFRMSQPVGPILQSLQTQLMTVLKMSF